MENIPGTITDSVSVEASIKSNSYLLITKLIKPEEVSLTFSSLEGNVCTNMSASVIGGGSGENISSTEKSNDKVTHNICDIHVLNSSSFTMIFLENILRFEYCFF